VALLEDPAACLPFDLLTVQGALVSVQGDPAVLGVPWVPCRDLGLSANPLAALGCCLVAASSLGAPQAAAPQHHFQVTRQSRPQLTNQGLARFVPANQREAGLVNPCAASLKKCYQAV